MKIRNLAASVFLWGILSMSLCFGLAHASNIGFLKYAVIADFTQADVQQLQKKYKEVLVNKELGGTQSWENAETKAGGEITVIKKYKAEDHVCKRLKFKNYSKKQSATSYFNFCNIDNQWKIVN